MRVDGLACPYCGYGVEKQFAQAGRASTAPTSTSTAGVVIVSRLIAGTRFADERAATAIVHHAGFALGAIVRRPAQRVAAWRCPNGDVRGPAVGTLALAAPLAGRDARGSRSTQRAPPTVAGGPPGADRARRLGRLSDPNGIRRGRAAAIHVADSRNHRIQVFTRRQAPSSSSGPSPACRPPRWKPRCRAAASSYAADYWNDVIRVYALDDRRPGPQLSADAGTGPGQLPEPRRRRRRPRRPDLFVADTANQRVQQLDRLTASFVRRVGRRPARRGYVLRRRVSMDPIDVAVAADGTLFVADGFNDRIQPGVVRARTAAFVRKWGGPFAVNIRGSPLRLVPGARQASPSVPGGLDGLRRGPGEPTACRSSPAPARSVTAFGTPHDGPGASIEQQPVVGAAADGTPALHASTSSTTGWRHGGRARRRQRTGKRGRRRWRWPWGCSRSRAAGHRARRADHDPHSAMPARCTTPSSPASRASAASA
ncbi:MAG: hypothetical protein U5K33_01250 [Halofilum sp. (in: g-proteobacteria)]|nr:hypothetical protein [Halofilum sp. (in: g-proteobacteria)]